LVQSLNYNSATESITVTATAGGASSNVVYTCPNFYDAIVTFLHKEDNAYYTIINNKSIAGQDVYNMITGDRLYLHAGDKITAFNGGGSNLGVTVSVEEHYNPNRR
jgi:hypothetical protein